MSGSARTRANRLNALRSTGPRTEAGKRRSAANALKVGLFSRLLVIPALGETQEDLDRFRRAVVADLAPAGAVEAEQADRVAILMWRLRRVPQYEAAAMSAAAGELPPHPDEVAPLSGIESTLPLPPGATTAQGLAHLRTQMRPLPTWLAARRAAAGVLAGGGDAEPVDDRAAAAALRAAADELGWVLVPDPWPAVFVAAGCPPECVRAIAWDAGGLRLVLRTAAAQAGRDADAFPGEVRERLLADAGELEELMTERRAEESQLAAQLLREREALAAAGLYADGGRVERAARAEGHLSRELERALAVLARVQAGRRSDAGTGFVLQSGVER